MTTLQRKYDAVRAAMSEEQRAAIDSSWGAPAPAKSTGPSPYSIAYVRVGGRWTRYTLAFLCQFQWTQRNHYKDRKVKGTGPRNYSIWPVFCDAGKV